MSDYNDIGAAFGRYCETAWRLVGDARAVARHLLTRMEARGQIPDGRLKLCPPLAEKLDPTVSWDIKETVRHKGGDSWVIGFLLEVVRGEDIWPREYLRFNIELTMGEEIRAQLWDSQTKISFAAQETADTHKALDDFSDAILKSIHDFYDQHPKRLKNGGAAIKGFSQLGA